MSRTDENIEVLAGIGGSGYNPDETLKDENPNDEPPTNPDPNETKDLTATGIPEDDCVPKGDNFHLPDEAPKASEDWLEFDHWEDETGASYDAGDDIDMNKPKDMTAKWRERKFRLFFDANLPERPITTVEIPFTLTDADGDTATAKLIFEPEN